MKVTQQGQSALPGKESAITALGEMAMVYRHIEVSAEGREMLGFWLVALTWRQRTGVRQGRPVLYRVQNA